jgi:hypothetical protein
MVQRDPMDDWKLQEEAAVGWRQTGPRKVVFVHQSVMELNPHDLISRLDGKWMWGPKA